MGQQTTDSAMEQTSVLLGVVVSAHGIRGQFKVKPFTADPFSVAAYGEVELGLAGVWCCRQNQLPKG